MNKRSHKFRFFRSLKTTRVHKRFDKLIKDRGLTYTAAGKLLKYDVSNIHKIAKGKRPFPIEKVPEFSRALDVRPEYLIDAYMEDIRDGLYKYFENLEKYKFDDES